MLPVDGSPAYVTYIEDALTPLQAIVGGFVEPLDLPHSMTLWMNEEGKYERLPVNLWANRIVAVANPGLHKDDFIVGQCVITGLLDENGARDGDIHDIPDATLELAARAGVPVEDRTDA